MKRLITIVLVVTQCHLFAFRDIKSTFYFDSDIDTLNVNQHQELLNFIKKSTADNLYKEIYVVGFTDADGSNDYNIDLSKRRATFVTSLLVKNGLPEILIDKNFKGEENPVAKNTTELNKSRNRRVEVILRLFDIKTAADVVKELNGNPEQVFILDNTKEGFIQGKNGMKFIFPPYCFKTNGNKKIDYANIKITLTEVSNVKQGFFSNVLTESNEGLLETGGMFKLTAYNSDVELDMKDNMQYTVQIANNNVKDNMTVYAPETASADGLIRWSNTTTAFEKTSSFKGAKPYLKLDEDIIKAWKVHPEMDSLLKFYSFSLPAKPVLPKYPAKPYPPYEPKITAIKYDLPWFKRIFTSKSKQQRIREMNFNKDYEVYKSNREKYELKLAKYSEDTAKYRDIEAGYKIAYKKFNDTIQQKIKEAYLYRIALFENAFAMNFNNSKSAVLFKLKNKILYSHDVCADILSEYYKQSMYKKTVVNPYYAEIFSAHIKKLKALTGNENLFYERGAYGKEDIGGYIRAYSNTESTQFKKLMKADKSVYEHVTKCEQDLIDEEVKLGLFDPKNFNVFYQASLSNFGWINCDRFLNYKQDEIFTLRVPNYKMEDKNIFAIVKDINSQISIPLMANNMHSVRLPKNKEIVIVAIGLDKSLTPMYAKQTITGTNDIKVDLTFKQAKLSEIRDMIESI